MIPVMIFLVVIIIAYVIISYYNDKSKEAKGICKTSGSTCSSPTGCSCGDVVKEHED